MPLFYFALMISLSNLWLFFNVLIDFKFLIDDRQTLIEIRSFTQGKTPLQSWQSSVLVIAVSPPADDAFDEREEYQTSPVNEEKTIPLQWPSIWIRWSMLLWFTSLELPLPLMSRMRKEMERGMKRRNKKKEKEKERKTSLNGIRFGGFCFINVCVLSLIACPC